jgi:hypothetical protein
MTPRNRPNQRLRGGYPMTRALEDTATNQPEVRS